MYSIGACFSKGSHYPEQPFTQKQEVVSEKENTTQEDLEKRKEMQLKLLFARLDVMGMNANLERERKELEKKKLAEQGKEEPQIDMDNFEPYDLGEG